MAAGRHNLSRKRYNYSKDETHLCRHGCHKKASSRCRDNWTSERTVNSAGWNNDRWKNGFVDTIIHKDGEAGYGCGRLGRIHDSESQGRCKEDPVLETGAGIVSVKKRKFSPIVWDRDEKKVNISKNRIHPTSPVFSQPSPPKSSKAFGQSPDVVDVRIERCSPTDEQHISPVDSLVSNVSDGSEVPDSFSQLTPVILSEKHTRDDKEQEKMEEGGYVEERNLSKSKWAFEDSPRLVSEVHNSSPESGEFKGEGSEGDGVVSSLSDESGHFTLPTSGDEQSENELRGEAVLEIVDKVGSDSLGCYSSENDDDDYDRGTTQPAEIPKHRMLGMMCGCRNVFEFERLNKISEGTYGVVYKARDKKTGDIVALKKVKMGKEREGFPVTALREINILGSLHHPSIVEVKEVVMDDFDGVYMVMEYIDHELKGFMDSMKQPFSQSQVKCLMLQLLEGLSYLHDSWVIHRDLKTSNLLLNNNGELKICDFGMARQYGSPLKPFTPLVVTLWYRAPEVLLGMKQYSTAIDMWSVGCVMAEMLSKKPLFDGNRELEQIDKIFRILGTPNDKLWPGYSRLPGVKPNFVKQPFNNLRKIFPAATFTGSPVLTELGFDLLNKLLTYDPKKRITAEEALNHGWFREVPLPAEYVRMCK